MNEVQSRHTHPQHDGETLEHRHQVSDRRNSNERGRDTSSGRGEPGVHDANRRRRRGRLSRVGGRSERGVFVGTGAPTFGDPLGEVLAYHAENRGVVAVSVGLEAVKLPLLLLFVTGLHGLVQRRGGAGADWSRLAVAAGATLSAVIALVMTTHIAVVLAADGLAEPTPAFELAWQLHAAAFALELPVLGATLIGAALATHASGLTRPWQRLLGVAGGSLLILAGAGNLAIADGSPLLFVGLPGFAAWLVWLVVTGLRLIRGQG